MPEFSIASYRGELKAKKLAQLESNLKEAQDAQIAAEAALEQSELRLRAAYSKIAVRSLQTAASELLGVFEDCVLPPPSSLSSSVSSSASASALITISATSSSPSSQVPALPPLPPESSIVSAPAIRT